jgi:hypothetical protein
MMFRTAPQKIRVYGASLYVLSQLHSFFSNKVRGAETDWLKKCRVELKKRGAEQSQTSSKYEHGDGARHDGARWRR